MRTRAHLRDHVVVVGGGAAGVLAAAALLDGPTAAGPVPFVTLVDPAARPGAGLAYGRADAHHLLNSPAGRMGALERDPGGFVRWSAGSGTPLEPAAFAPRRRYGQYLQHVAATLLEERPRDLTAVRARATLVRPQGTAVVVSLDNGWDLVADHVVLALGNPPPGGGVLDGVAARERVADPWSPGALDPVGPNDRVTLVGTGLTAVDVATSLARRHPTVSITMVSRHGLLPAAHPRTPAGAGDGIVPAAPGLCGVLAAFSRAWHEAARQGVPWQHVVDGVRPQVNDLWAALGPAGRERFVERCSRRWEVLRHRMAPSVADELAGLVRSGVVTVRAGRAAEVPADVVMDCTGPRPFASRGWNDLVDALLDYGVARPDALGIGLDVDDDGALVDQGGATGPRLWALGPARRGHQWESTAVPEIRQHAARIATLLRPAPSDAATQGTGVGPRARVARRSPSPAAVPGVGPGVRPADVVAVPSVEQLVPAAPQARGLD